MPNPYLPEGRLMSTPNNQAACACLSALQDAADEELILEGRALLCNADHDLIVAVGPFTGRIPRTEAALGLAEGTTREIAILSRVGKPVCFTVTAVSGTQSAPVLTLSRRRAQELALAAFMERLTPGSVIPATVTHLEPFGAFVDIGCGVVSMIGIENISVSRIPHPDRRFSLGQEIFAIVTNLEPSLGRINLTHKELLGTWEENVAGFAAGMTVPGYVRGIKEYGAFIELTPNLSGLAELRPDLIEGDRVSVYIKGIFPDRMKIKLLIIDRLPPTGGPPAVCYFITDGQLTHWKYAPNGCKKAGVQMTFDKP
jgi:small subunit ribosomal protein S1